LLVSLIFAAVNRFTGHVTGVEMELPRFVFTRLFLLEILVVGHATLL
jgi:hypothetical protein